MYDTLKEQCLKLNRQLKENNLVKLTWGNASIRSSNAIAIKPSGIPYDELTTDKMPVLDLITGDLVSGICKPSVDFNMHHVLYKAIPGLNSIVHTHSTYCTIWAQVPASIPCMGTTHADYFSGPIPIIRTASNPDKLVPGLYETFLGELVLEAYNSFKTGFKPKALLLPYHGLVTLGSSPSEALEAAIVAEEVAKMALYAGILDRMNIHKMPVLYTELFDFHFNRKNGDTRYYGQ